MKGKVVFIMISFRNFFLIMLAFSCIALHESNSTIVPMHYNAQTLPLGNSLAGVVCLYVCFFEHTEILFNLSMIIENTVLVNQEKNKYSTVQCVCKLYLLEILQSLLLDCSTQCC